jgi:hypothetical protein
MKAEKKIKYVKAIHPSQPEWEYYLPKEDKALIKKSGYPQFSSSLYK